VGVESPGIKVERAVSPLLLFDNHDFPFFEADRLIFLSLLFPGDLENQVITILYHKRKLIE
jgi:hypothetical protein